MGGAKGSLPPSLTHGHPIYTALALAEFFIKFIYISVLSCITLEQSIYVCQQTLASLGLEQNVTESLTYMGYNRLS